MSLAVALAAAAPGLSAGTPILLVTETEISSEANVRGDAVPVHVTEDVVVDSVVIVPRGTAGMGQVTVAECKAAYGRGGRVAIELLYLTVSGRSVRLRGTFEVSARGSDLRLSGRNVVSAAVAVAITGKRATIASGTRLTGYVMRDWAYKSD